MTQADDMGVTDNAVLLLGYIAGAIARRAEDATYEPGDVCPASGTQVMKHRLTGNTYRLSVVQLEGTE